MISLALVRASRWDTRERHDGFVRAEDGSGGDVEKKKTKQSQSRLSRGLEKASEGRQGNEKKVLQNPPERNSLI